MTLSPWPRIRLKYTCQVNPPAPRVADDQEVTFVPMEAVGERGGISTDATRPAGAVRQGYTGFRDGDVVVAKITPCFENGKGSIVEGLLGGVGYGTTELHVLRAQDSDRRWLFYVTESKHFMGLGEGAMFGAGGQKRVPPDFVRNYEAWTPPVPTQKAIAAFLDRKTAAIDALIEKKQKLLDLLAEKRAALINQAVTKGLDPTVPMKDSGIPWIGEIPAHWEVKRLKDVSSFVTSGPRGWGQYYSEAGPLFLRITNVARDRIDLLLDEDKQQSVSPPPGAEGARTLAQEGDVLVTITADLGSVGVVPGGLGDAYISQHVALCRPTPEIGPRLLAYMVRGPWGRVHYDLAMNGGTKVGLTLDDVRNTPVAVPPVGEQPDLLARLDRSLGQFESTSKQLGCQIERLQEYRQALITPAVTGQLDIGEEAA